MVIRTALLAAICSAVVAASAENDASWLAVDGCRDGSSCPFGDGGNPQSHEYDSSRLPTSARRHGLRSNFCRKKQTVECQDHTLCPTGYSCCHSPEYPVGSYSCCPYGYSPVCCADGSCCAQGFRCETKWGICTPEVYGRHANSSSSAKKPRFAIGAGRGPRDVRSPRLIGVDEPTARIQCPDGRFCHQGSTCCPSSSSGTGRGPAFSCCPHEEAQCCGDREHCCPSGTRCLRSRGGYRCLIGSSKGRGSLPASRKYVSFNDESYPSVPCPTWMICSTGQCCRDQYGAYRCSPYVDGVCCASGIVGCPAGMECAS